MLYFQKCPICESTVGYKKISPSPFSFDILPIHQCKSCKAKFKLNYITIPHTLTLVEIGKNSNAKSLKGKYYPIGFWQNLNNNLLTKIEEEKILSSIIQENETGTYIIGLDLYYTQSNLFKPPFEVLKTIEQKITFENKSLENGILFFKETCKTCYQKRYRKYIDVQRALSKRSSLSYSIILSSGRSLLDVAAGDFTTSTLREQKSDKALEELGSLREYMSCANCGSKEIYRILYFGNFPI